MFFFVWIFKKKEIFQLCLRYSGTTSVSSSAVGSVFECLKNGAGIIVRFNFTAKNRVKIYENYSKKNVEKIALK